MPHVSCVASASDVCSANITRWVVEASPLNHAFDNWRACARGATLSSIGVPDSVVGTASSALWEGDADDERLGILDPESCERGEATGREVQERPSERRGGRISSSEDDEDEEDESEDSAAEDDEDEEDESEDSAADDKARVRCLELFFGAERREDCTGGRKEPQCHRQQGDDRQESHDSCHLFLFLSDSKIVCRKRKKIGHPQRTILQCSRRFQDWGGDCCEGCPPVLFKKTSWPIGQVSISDLTY